MAGNGTDDWRDNNKMQQYRRQSQSTDPSKVAGHILSLEVAKHIAIAGSLNLDKGTMKDLLNSFDNLRMISEEGNRLQHNLDQKLISKSQTHVQLTKEELERAKQQVAVINRKRDEYTRAGFFKAAQKFYQKFGLEL